MKVKDFNRMIKKCLEQSGVRFTKNTILKRFSYLTISEQPIKVQIAKINEI